MLPYSYAHPFELAPDLDAITYTGSVLDSFARDSQDFDSASCADSLNEYLDALHAAIDCVHTRDDERARSRVEGAPARAHVRAHELCDALTPSRDATVTRYLSRFVNSRV